MPNETLEQLLLQNPNAPTNDEYAREFARKLYPHRDQRAAGVRHFDFAEGGTDFAAADDEQVNWCGEASRGLLDAVLASDLLSDAARADINAIIVDAAPALERQKTVGHFRFSWTEVSSNPNDNTNEANIDATAAVLNDCWNRYVADFREPKADLIGGQRIINVVVYDDPGLHGSTSSHSNQIFLNSRTVVNDNCRRQTTSAHELFHRVEYSYGYVTGTAGQTWWVEALGSWSQEYYAPAIDDYINRVNSGLNNPGRELLVRSYDACHYWKYVGEQLSKRSAVVASEAQAIREVLDAYASNGLDARLASATTTQNRISRSFDRFFQDWSKANYIKDLDNPFVRYEYDEDETVTTGCGRTYGPYRHVAPVTDETITSDAFTWSAPGLQSVGAYGTRYHHFKIDPSVTRFEARFRGNTGGGSGAYSVHLIMIKDNRWRVIYNSPNVTEASRSPTFTAGQYDRCVLVVNGLATGGAYELSINTCMSGVWKDNFNFIWTLTQSGGNITGTVETGSCGTYAVTGTLTGSNVVLNAAGACCDFVYKGPVVNCASASGDWTNDCGGSGSWTMNKVDPSEVSSVLEDEAEEFGDDPATMRT